MLEKTSILYDRYIVNFHIIYIRLNHLVTQSDMPSNHIYHICELLTDHLFVFQPINGYRKLCLSKESAIAKHQLFKIVNETVTPCLSFPLGINLVLETEIFTDTKLFTKWPCCCCCFLNNVLVISEYFQWMMFRNNSLNPTGPCSMSKNTHAALTFFFAFHWSLWPVRSKRGHLPYHLSLTFTQWYCVVMWTAKKQLKMLLTWNYSPQ